MSSYLVESSEGFVRPWLPSSHTLLASSFPMDDITLISSMGQSSRSSDLTRERWVPRFRWIPEHSIHMRAPKFKLAQLGSTGRETGAKLSQTATSHSQCPWILTSTTSQSPYDLELLMVPRETWWIAGSRVCTWTEIPFVTPPQDWCTAQKISCVLRCLLWPAYDGGKLGTKAQVTSKAALAPISLLLLSTQLGQTSKIKETHFCERVWLAKALLKRTHCRDAQGSTGHWQVSGPVRQLYQDPAPPTMTFKVDSVMFQAGMNGSYREWLWDKAVIV